MATTLFISYAHRDEDRQQEVIEALRPLVERGLLDVWHDRRMVAGDDIFPNIAAALERARIVVLLVSDAFLGSEECAREMWRALDNRRKRGTVVVPVILRRCDWRGAPFGKINALPVDGAPLDQAADRPAAMAAVAGGIAALAERLVQADAARLRRRRRLLAGTAVALLPFAVWKGWPTRTGAVTVPTELTLPRGVFVLAEIRVTAPDGRAWNPQVEGLWRLPAPLLCFRQASYAEEVCPAATFATAQGGAGGRPANASHVARAYATLTAWNRHFSIRLKNQHLTDKPVLGQGDCQLGLPCRIVADRDAATLIAEVLVLPALDGTGRTERAYLERCVAPESLLAQHWQTLSILGGVGTDLNRLSYRDLALRYGAVADFELAPGLLDALFDGRSPAFAAAGARAPYRADLWSAIWAHADREELSLPLRLDVSSLVVRLQGRLHGLLDRAAPGHCAGPSDGSAAPVQPSSAS